MLYPNFIIRGLTEHQVAQLMQSVASDIIQIRLILNHNDDKSGYEYLTLHICIHLLVTIGTRTKALASTIWHIVKRGDDHTLVVYYAPFYQYLITTSFEVLQPSGIWASNVIYMCAIIHLSLSLSLILGQFICSIIVSTHNTRDSLWGQWA